MYKDVKCASEKEAMQTLILPYILDFMIKNIANE